MHLFTVAGFVVALLVAAAQCRAQDVPELPKPQKEHQWLTQLAGEWESECSMYMDPDKPPLKSKGTETVRSIGGFWIMAENKGEAFGQPFTGLLTLGYDARKKRYVGTWVDSMTSYLWTYEGTVDDSGKVLTLTTEGPSHSGSGTSQYRETLDLKNADHKIFSSYVQGEDGKWVKFMRIDYYRKK